MSKPKSIKDFKVPELRAILGVKNGKKADIYADYLKIFKKEEKKKDNSPKKSNDKFKEAKFKLENLEMKLLNKLEKSSGLSYESVEKILYGFRRCTDLISNAKNSSLVASSS